MYEGGNGGHTPWAVMRGSDGGGTQRGDQGQAWGAAGKLAAGELRRPTFGVLWVHGPGGVGKTALCGMFAERARAAGRPVRVCDARDADLSREGLRALGEPVAGQVTIIDTFERCAPVEYDALFAQAGLRRTRLAEVGNMVAMEAVAH